MITVSPAQRLRSTIAVLVVSVAASACSQRAAPEPDATADAAIDGAAPDVATAAPPGPDDVAAFDREGVPVPQRVQALGSAIPRGFKRVHQENGAVVYVGRVESEKVHAFYQKYLDCPWVVEARKGWRWEGAIPRAPGDVSRTVDVVVVKTSPTESQVIVTDKTPRPGAGNVLAPDSGPTYEDLVRQAHQGSVSQPIPGTY